MNDAATASGIFPLDGSSGSSSVAQAVAAIRYDGVTQGYTLTVGGRSATFLPSDVDASQSTRATTVYARTTGTTTDTLTLTNAGASGRFTYQYVGSALWQRTTTDATAISGIFDAIAYGIATPDAVVPRAGSADYPVDLIGVETGASTVHDIAGQGVLQVDFAGGAVTTQGIATSAIGGTATFTSSAQLSSSSNAFSGDFHFNDSSALLGNLDGRFFGPAGEEVGAAFSASDGGGGFVTGTIIGRRDPAALTPPSPLATLTTATDFAFSAVAPSQGELGVTQVRFDPVTNSYSLSLSNPQINGAPVYSFAMGPANRDGAASDGSVDAFTGVINGRAYTATMLQPVLGNATLELTYTSLAVLRPVSGASSDLRSDRHYVAFGMATPISQMPRDGTAAFTGIARGSGMTQTGGPSSVTNFYDLNGTASLTVDFANSGFTSALSLTGTDLVSGNPTSFSTIGFNGTVVGNGFAALDEGATMAGKFFGPNAEEAGGSFHYSQTDVTGAKTELDGAFVGKR